MREGHIALTTRSTHAFKSYLLDDVNTSAARTHSLTHSPNDCYGMNVWYLWWPINQMLLGNNSGHHIERRTFFSSLLRWQSKIDNNNSLFGGRHTECEARSGRRRDQENINKYRMRSRFIKTKLSVNITFFFFFNFGWPTAFSCALCCTSDAGTLCARAKNINSRLIEWLKIRTKIFDEKLFVKGITARNRRRYVTAPLSRRLDKKTARRRSTREDISVLMVIETTLKSPRRRYGFYLFYSRHLRETRNYHLCMPAMAY